MSKIKIIAWDFDGVLTRNIIDGRFIWADNFEADIGHSKEYFEEFIFGKNLDAILTGKEDLRDRVDAWAKSVSYAPGPDAILEYWFTKDANLDPMMLKLMQRIEAQGLRQIITTNNETRRTTYIENKLGFSSLVEHIFASGRMGIAKPDPTYFETVSATLNVNPNEIFFIDDSAENIDAAKIHGWQAMHFTAETRHRLEALLPL